MPVPKKSPKAGTPKTKKVAGGVKRKKGKR